MDSRGIYGFLALMLLFASIAAAQSYLGVVYLWERDYEHSWVYVDYPFEFPFLSGAVMQLIKMPD